MVTTNTLDDVVRMDWRGFFQERVYLVTRRAPLGGIEAGGWKLVYDEEPTEWFKGIESLQ